MLAESRRGFRFPLWVALFLSARWQRWSLAITLEVECSSTPIFANLALENLITEDGKRSIGDDVEAWNRPVSGTAILAREQAASSHLGDCIHLPVSALTTPILRMAANAAAAVRRAAWT